MPAPTSVNPLEALDAVTGKIKHPRTIRVGVEEAEGSYLAEPISGPARRSSFPSDPPGEPRSALDGYALADGCGTGDILDCKKSLANLLNSGREVIPAGKTFRVETGEPLPAKVWAILPIQNSTLLDGDKIRIDHLPQPGEGVLGRSAPPPGTLEAGRLLTRRHTAHLLAAGVASVNVFARPRVGVLLLGEELTDLKTEAEKEQVYDLNGYWLISEIEALGLDVVPFGISEDGPGGLQKHLVRCHTRRIEVLILCGGMGSGINDRTGESIRELNGKVLFERLSLQGCSSLLFGKLNDMDVLGLSGSPLSCSAGFDLFCRPLLLARSGASGFYWNWAAATFEDEMLEPPLLTESAPGAWFLQAGKSSGKSSESHTPQVVKTWNPETPFSPFAPGSQGWVLRPGDPEATAVYFSPHP